MADSSFFIFSQINLMQYDKNLLLTFQKPNAVRPANITRSVYRTAYSYLKTLSMPTKSHLPVRGWQKTFHPTCFLCVHMENKTFSPVAAPGTALSAGAPFQLTLPATDGVTVRGSHGIRHPAPFLLFRLLTESLRKEETTFAFTLCFFHFQCKGMKSWPDLQGPWALQVRLRKLSKLLVIL